jgi:hypothetical protein
MSDQTGNTKIGPVKLFEHSITDNKFINGITENGAHVCAEIKSHVGDMVHTVSGVFHLQKGKAPSTKVAEAQKEHSTPLA